MGRIKNIIIEKQREYEDDLDSLRKELATKESEFLNFELQQHLSLIWENINEIKRRLDNLEKKIDKPKNKVKTTNIFAIFVIIGGLAAYYKNF